MKKELLFTLLILLPSITFAQDGNTPEKNPFEVIPQSADINTAGNYPNTQFKVYDVHNKNVYEYDKKGIKSISNW